MARKETFIPEKVIKSNVKVEVTCDCCGDNVDSYWHMSSNQDGCLFEYTSPIDLCEKHSIILIMQFSESLIRSSTLIHDTENLVVKRIRNTF